jgi:hypothetical protein
MIGYTYLEKGDRFRSKILSNLFFWHFQFREKFSGWGSVASTGTNNNQDPVNKTFQPRISIVCWVVFRKLVLRFAILISDNLGGIQFSTFIIFPKAFKRSQTIRRVLLQALLSISWVFFKNQPPGAVLVVEVKISRPESSKPILKRSDINNRVQ